MEIVAFDLGGVVINLLAIFCLLSGVEKRRIWTFCILYISTSLN